MLNLKKVRVRLTGEGPETLYLKVSKAGTVKAKDIEKNASVEILNPDQEIANIDAGATLEMKLKFQKEKATFWRPTSRIINILPEPSLWTLFFHR